MGGTELRTEGPKGWGMRCRERAGPAAALVAAACIGVGGAAGASAQEVAQSHEVASAFRGGGPNTGVVETAGVDRLGALAWRFRTGGPVRSTPAVAGGAVYFGSSDGHLYALDARSGAVLWRRDVGTAVGGAPLVTGDRVVFTDRANRVHAVDRATGSALWRVETGPDLPLPWGWEGWDYILPSAAPAGANVLVGSGDGHLYALDVETGAERWCFATGGRVRGTAAVHDGVAWFGSGDGVLYGVSVADGGEVARFETRGTGLEAADFGFDRRQIQASPALRGGTLYIGSRDASLYALDLETLEPRWTLEEGSAWVVASAAVDGGRVYSGRSSSGTVNAIDAATGERLWSVETGGPVFSSPVVVGETVYVASGGGRLRALDAADGGERWSYSLGAGSYATPAVADGRVYVGSDDGHLYAFRAAEGPSPRAAVYHDETMMARSAFGGTEAHKAIADHFAGRGWEVLDTAGLRDFLEARIEDGAPSVVIFAMDGLPATVASDEAGPRSLLRRYMEAGGRAVWLGRPPLLYARDQQGRVTDVDRGRPSRLLGVDLGAWNADLYGVTPTDAGRRQGLETPWVGEPWLAHAEGVVPLAVDELGRVSAWARGYGGRPGSGFVVLRASTRPALLEEIRRVAEYGVLRDPVEGSR